MTREHEAMSAISAIRGGARAADLESEHLDFKQEARSPDETAKVVAQAAICFANGSGGTIVLGVSDQARGPAALIGTTLAPEQVQRRIFALTQPPLVVDVRPVPIEGGLLLLLLVPQSPEIHADTQGRASRRVGTDCRAMSPAEQAILREEKHGVDRSAQPSVRSLADLDPAAMAIARKWLGGLLDPRRELAGLSDGDLLRALGVVSAQGQLLFAGEVLFCRAADLPEPIATYQYRSTSGGEPRLVERFTAPLLVAFERLMDLIHIRREMTPVSLPDGQQLQIDDFPELAVREALINGFMHRDYHLAGPVSVEHSPEVFVVSSPGPLVGGVTPANILTHPSKPRNPALAHAIRTLGLAEEVGRGVDRMYREMIRSGRSIPAIQSESDRVRVSLVGGAPNTLVARFVAQLPPEEREDTDTLLVILNLCGRRLVDATALAPLLQKTPPEVEATLRRLASDRPGLIEPTRESARRAQPSYRLRAGALKLLGTAVSYHQRTTDDMDRKLTAHLLEYGKVTNRTVQNLLDVDIQRAKDLLRDWVARGLVVKAAGAARGPGIEYSPGPGLPAASERRRNPRTAAKPD